MKKDIEWLKAQICTEMMYLDHIRKERWSGVKYQTLRSVSQKINQLDETEVLSQKWIDEHSFSLLDGYPWKKAVLIDDLQNLLVPKQGELEVKIQELIEAYEQEYGAYSDLENGWIDGFIKDLKNLVEKEQKYHVTDENDTLLCKSNGVVMTVGKLWAIGNEHEAEYDLTEQEIKDYDERFWAFAEPVEVAE